MKRLRLLGGIVFVVSLLWAVGIIFSNPKAEAATLNVNGGCTLNNAINSVNSVSDTGGCTSTGTYGTNDTINLPSGTQTLAADLPAITKPLKVIGAGKTSSTIDADGFKGFETDYWSNQFQYDISFQGFTLSNAAPYGILTLYTSSVEMTNLNVTNSGQGALVFGISVSVSNTDVLNNSYIGSTDYTDGYGTGSTYNQGGFAGLNIMARGSQSSDIPTVTVVNTRVLNNSARFSGLLIGLDSQTGSGDVSLMRTSVRNSQISGNSASWEAGLGISGGGPFEQVGNDLSLNAITVANNSVTVTDPNPIGNNPFLTSAQPYIAGMFVYGNILNEQNIVNLTAANNSVTNLLDDQLSIAGFVGAISSSGESLAFNNATIINNAVEQTQNGYWYDNAITNGNNTSFYTIKFQLGEGIDILDGGTARNSIIAGNTRNGNIGTCAQADKLLVIGVPGILDVFPQNLGNNITDDPNCTGYTVVPTILSTLGPLQDNGGPVPTIALLPGSPAIGSAAQVLGISTDARGIARPSTPDVGAYQTVLGTNTLPNSGTVITDIGVPSTGYGPKQENISIMNIIFLVSVITSLYIAMKSLLHA